MSDCKNITGSLISKGSIVEMTELALSQGLDGPSGKSFGIVVGRNDRTGMLRVRRFGRKTPETWSPLMWKTADPDSAITQTDQPKP